ncbi:MAG: hypothetical protein LQ337_004643 [Flavoplaca oasis]|nr:MAG: hypothetical protein LQ337_004643 [Flavoplaca oasis]
MADYQRVSDEDILTPDTTSPNPTVEHYQEDQSPPATAGFYYVPSSSGDSDSSTSSEYLDVSTAGKSDDSDVPNEMGDAGRTDAGMSYNRAHRMPSETRSHIIPIDSPTPEPFPRPAVPHPDAGLGQLQKDLKGIIVYTLHVDEKQPLADAEAQASSMKIIGPLY